MIIGCCETETGGIIMCGDQVIYEAIRMTVVPVLSNYLINAVIVIVHCVTTNFNGIVILIKSISGFLIQMKF